MKNPILVLAEKWRAWSKVQRGLVVVLAVGFCLVVVGSRQRAVVLPSTAVSAYPPVSDEPQYAQVPVPSEDSTAFEANERKRLPVAPAKKEARDKDDERIEGSTTTRASLNDPLIAHTAELAVATREFSKSRTSLQ